MARIPIPTLLILLLLVTIQICGALSLASCRKMGLMSVDKDGAFIDDYDNRIPHTLGLPDGEYNLRFQGYYLTQPEVGEQSVLLDYNQGVASEWQVINNIKRGIAIRNVQSGLYLAYITPHPFSMLRLQPTPMYWALRQQEPGGRIQIQATELYHGEILVIGELPMLTYPPQIGLVLPQKGGGGDQGWDFKPTVRPTKHWSDLLTLPYRKFGRWWNWI
ncbi:hypothetical protein BGW41_002521 [Actinomortierella wolfii]|nr:hypothetical protein BGW41_002521 [Actinomortierella wolfii]